MSAFPTEELVAFNAGGTIVGSVGACQAWRFTLDAFITVGCGNGILLNGVSSGACLASVTCEAGFALGWAGGTSTVAVQVEGGFAGVAFS